MWNVRRHENCIHGYTDREISTSPGFPGYGADYYTVVTPAGALFDRTSALGAAGRRPPEQQCDRRDRRASEASVFRRVTAQARTHVTGVTVDGPTT